MDFVQLPKALEVLEVRVGCAVRTRESVVSQD